MPQIQSNSKFKRLLPLGYALAAIVAVILFFMWAALQGQTALAGALNGESMWSKAQNRATFDLLAYAGSGNEADYADFRRNYAVVIAYNSARDQVLSGNFDYRHVVATLHRAYMMPVSIPSIIFVFHHFADAPYMATALKEWHASDTFVAELGEIAASLHRQYSTRQVDPAKIAGQIHRIAAINKSVQQTTNEFSVTLARGSVVFAKVVSAGVTFFVFAALLVWGWIARRVLTGIRGDQERYRRLFDGTADAILMVDEASGRIIDANPAAGAWTGLDPQELRGGQYASLFAREALRGGLWGDNELCDCDGRTRPVEIQSHLIALDGQMIRQAIIHDMSARAEHEREIRTAAEALASIAEGVIIADTHWRVVSANSAATRLTGFAQESLLGMYLGETRQGADGAPLPAAMWREIEKTGHWSGDVQSRRADGSLYTEKLGITAIREVDQRVRYFVAVFSDTSVAEASRRRLEHVATHDALTGLVNRVEFERLCQVAIERTRTDGTAVAVLFIDLDNFKVVNDSYGHAMGDRFLIPVSERILGQLREGDVASRIGGDEFTVLMPRLVHHEEAASLARRLCAALAESFEIDTCEMTVTASIGIAVSAPGEGDATSLVADADAAMYVAKTEERNTWRFYTPAVHADASRRRMLATELRRALACDEFRMLYQPIIEIESGRVTGVEALLRWQHPTRGIVMPGDFIPAAERMGLIRHVDEWVMRAVCAQIRRWDRSGLPSIRVALNVSALWFGHTGFVEAVQAALQESAVEPTRLVLEITEGAILRMGKDTDRTLRALDALGIGIAVDDFGTGYASMAYLKLPAVAYLKIDRSFVTGLPMDTNNAVIARAVVAMATNLGLVTIAEGIETEAERKFLRQTGCVEGQGYLYSHPLPPDAIVRMLRSRQQGAEPRSELVASPLQ
ncbi:MAG TPA: EAL domain-containing protein [Rhodanobacteraceae bacterium]|nr:EAL domain-containing protein [Rhodanobacteraceae bacterium]